MFRIVTALSAPLLVIGLLEAGLRIGGYGYSTAFFIKLPGQNLFTTNRKFSYRFSPKEAATPPYPLFLPGGKEPGVKRIFILGGSAAQGTPAPAFGAGRILEVMIRQQYPKEQLEIYNVALRGINSHAIISIAKECAKHQPDMFLIYMGNNEAIGLHCPNPEQHFSPPLWLLRSSQWLKDTRIGQLMTNLAQAGRARPKMQDMEYFRKQRLPADSPLKNSIYANFQANLDKILASAHHAGAKVLLCTVAGNLVDFPPLASLHRPDLTADNSRNWETSYHRGIDAEKAHQDDVAITNYLEAAGLDDHFAELHYRMGRTYLAGKDYDKARQQFILARDWDALQFRTDSRLNQIIRETAAARKDQGVRLADVELVFNTTVCSSDYAAHAGLFHEHVHFTFAGDYLLARTLLPQVSSMLGLNIATKSEQGSEAVPTRADCATALAFSEWDELNMAVATATLTSKPPFLDQLDHAERQAKLEAEIKARRKAIDDPSHYQRAKAIYIQALTRRPNDWQIHMNFGMLLSAFGESQGALSEFRVAANLMPVFLPVRALYAKTLLETGKREAAVTELKDILKQDPEFGPAKEGLASIK